MGKGNTRAKSGKGVGYDPVISCQYDSKSVLSPWCDLPGGKRFRKINGDYALNKKTAHRGLSCRG